ncbi:MAG: flavodoxin [Lachnospiraceae bacterium]|nr:flavodoxin [Lachnospiraceae bacterium]
MSRKIVVFYSLGENTRMIAEKIQKVLGADLAEIQTAVPYTGSYNDIVEQGQDEVNKGFMPKLKELGISLDPYDEIILGTPTWWYTMAPAVLTFLKETDFTGKKVIPFQTHAGWPGHCLEDMEKAAGNAIVGNGKTIQFSTTVPGELVTKEAEIDAWISSLK